MKRRTSFVLALALVVSMLTVSVNAEENPTFVYARAASTTSFDLHQEITENNAFAIDKIFEPLVLFD